MAKAKKPASASSKSATAAKSDTKQTDDKSKNSDATSSETPKATSAQDNPSATPTADEKQTSLKSEPTKAAETPSSLAKTSTTTGKHSTPASGSSATSTESKTGEAAETSTLGAEAKSSASAAASGAGKPKDSKPEAGTAKAGSSKNTETTAKPADAYATTVSKPVSSSDTGSTQKTAAAASATSAANSANSDKASTSATAPNASTPDASTPSKTTTASSQSATAGSNSGRNDPPKRRSIFLPLVLGGIVAGGLGFAASELDLLERRAAPLAGDDELRTTLAEQQDRIAALENAPALEAPTATGEMPDLAPLQSQIETLTQTVDDLTSRLDILESRPVSAGEPEDLSATYEAQINELRESIESQQSELRATIDSQRTEIQGLLDNARTVEEATADAARTASIQSALSRVSSAVPNGRPYDAALEELEAAGVSDIPEELAQNAETGVTTLANLQDRFADAARNALTAARVAGGDTSETGVSGFLRRQLGARSVAPREGADPDAVLSRAEAAVRDGRLSEALTEIETLPEPARAAMQEWLQDARSRQSAEAATEALAQRLMAN